MHAIEHLGCQNDLVAPREIPDRPADNLFRCSVRINVGGVEKIDAKFERLLDQRAARLLAHRPGVTAALRNAERHAAEAKARDIKSCPAKFHVVHDALRSFSMIAINRISCSR